MQNTWMMEELSGKSSQMLSHPSNRHVPSFWVEQSPDLIMVFVSATQRWLGAHRRPPCSTSLHLSAISARLRKNVPEERRVQGTGKPWVGCPHCTTKVCYVCRFCQLASHIYASKQSGLASDGSSDCVLAVCLVVHLLFLGPFRPGIPLPSPQCVCGNRVGTKIPYKASASSKRRLPLSPAKVCRFLLEIVLLRIQSSTNAIYIYET